MALLQGIGTVVLGDTSGDTVYDDLGPFDIGPGCDGVGCWGTIGVSKALNKSFDGVSDGV